MGFDNNISNNVSDGVHIGHPKNFINNVTVDHIYVINLKHRKDRIVDINKNFKNTSIGNKLKRWDAVYGKELSEKEKYDKTSSFCYNFCSNGLIGCGLSHISLWKHIAENNLDNVLVLEDDAVPKHIQDFDNDLNNALNIIPTDYDIVYLGYYDNFLSKHYKKRHDIDGLIIPYMTFGLHSYLLSNKGANKLIKKFDKIKYHIDISLSLDVYGKDSDFKVYALENPIIDQTIADKNTSDLVNKQHPVINYIFSKIKFMNSYDLEYFISAPIITVRRLGFDINTFIVIFAVLSFLVSATMDINSVKIFAQLVTVLFIIEFAISRTKNVHQLVFELVVCYLFIIIGLIINKKTRQ